MEDEVQVPFLSPALPPDPPNSPDPPTKEDQKPDERMLRIRDLVRDALAHADSLQANLGVVNSDLMKMAYRLQPVVERAMDDPSSTWEDFEHLMPAIDTYLRITKQIAALTQLGLRLSAQEANG